MKTWQLFCTALLVAISAAPAWGHGFSIKLDGNAIVLNSGTDYFRHATQAPVLNGTISEFATIHGAFSGYQTSAPAGWRGFNADDTFSFSVVGPLWFSNGGPAVVAAPNAVMEAYDNAAPIAPQSPISFNGQTSGITPGFALSGSNTHELVWLLNIDNFNAAVDGGVYGLAYEVQGYEHGNVNAPYDPLLVYLQFETPDFSGTILNPNPLLLDAQNAVYAASQSSAISLATPEPSGIFVMGLALLAFGVCAYWRLKRARAA